MNKPLRVNDAVTAPVVLLIDENGQSVGSVSSSAALTMAKERGYDLVEVAPQANPPVCKLLDYGKLRYEETRAERRAKAHQKTITMKEIRLGLKISDHDLNLKIAQAQKFLASGDKVHFVLKMKGREQAFAERAFTLIEDISHKVGGKVEQAPSKMGNQISITLANE